MNRLEKFTVKPSLRLYFPQIFLIAWITIMLGYMVYLFPTNGVYVGQILEIKSTWLQKKLMNLLKYKITKSNMLISYGLIELYLGTIILNYWIKVELTAYTFTNKYLEIASGILQVKDSIDMVDIKTEELYKTPTDLSFGLSSLRLWTKDVHEPYVEIKGLKKEDAQRALDHIRMYSMRTFVDYKLSQDMKNTGDDDPDLPRKRSKTNKRKKDEDEVVDDFHPGDESSDPNHNGDNVVENDDHD